MMVVQKILFIDGAKSNNVAFLGDNLALLGKQNNWSGVIVNGCVRDVEIISVSRFWYLCKRIMSQKALRKIKVIKILKVNNVEIKPDANGFMLMRMAL